MFEWYVIGRQGKKRFAGLNRNWFAFMNIVFGFFYRFVDQNGEEIERKMRLIGVIRYRRMGVVVPHRFHWFLKRKETPD